MPKEYAVKTESSKLKLLMYNKRLAFYTMITANEFNLEHENDKKCIMYTECTSCTFEDACLGKKKPHPDSRCYEILANQKQF